MTTFIDGRSKSPDGAASGLRHTRIRAAYGTQQTRVTIAPADQRYNKPLNIVPASWVYRRGRLGQGLVKGNTN